MRGCKCKNGDVDCEIIAPTLMRGYIGAGASSMRGQQKILKCLLSKSTQMQTQLQPITRHAHGTVPISFGQIQQQLAVPLDGQRRCKKRKFLGVALATHSVTYSTRATKIIMKGQHLSVIVIVLPTGQNTVKIILLGDLQSFRIPLFSFV